MVGHTASLPSLIHQGCSCPQALVSSVFSDALISCVSTRHILCSDGYLLLYQGTFLIVVSADATSLCSINALDYEFEQNLHLSLLG